MTPQAICDTCKCRVQRAKKNRKESAIAADLKRKHQVSYVASCYSDKETATVVKRKTDPHLKTYITQNFFAEVCQKKLGKCVVSEPEY